jgi:hypothetical protein
VSENLCPRCGRPVQVWADRSGGTTINFACDNRKCTAGKAPWDTPRPVLFEAVALFEVDAHGNVVAEEGVTVCACGCKYWEHDRCIDCGERAR